MGFSDNEGPWVLALQLEFGQARFDAKEVNRNKKPRVAAFFHSRVNSHVICYYAALDESVYQPEREFRPRILKADKVMFSCLMVLYVYAV
jgi:hypothetical protein